MDVCRGPVLDEQPKAGELFRLVPGDVVTALNEKPFRNPRELLSQIRQLAPGSKATLTVFRNGQLVVVPVVIGQRPDMQ
jgi:S1-C subfamily serine protease